MPSSENDLTCDLRTEQ